MSDTARRSSRIAALPKKVEELVAAVTKPKAPARKPSNKRPAGEGEKVEKASKKSKPSKPAASSTMADDLKPIDIGDSLPSLTLKNEKGEDLEISTLAAEKGVILFLVPKADTPGCTTQACGFRDSYPDFTSQGFDVYCLSADDPSAQTKWQTKKELPYPLISDPLRKLIAALGAAEGGKTKRSHFIFAKGGKLVEKQNPVKPADSPQLALEFVKSLKADSA